MQLLGLPLGLANAVPFFLLLLFAYQSTAIHVRFQRGSHATWRFIHNSLTANLNCGFDEPFARTRTESNSPIDNT